MAGPHWAQTGLVFVVSLSACVMLLSKGADAEVEATSLLAEHRRVMQSEDDASYIEDYTLSGFRDFQIRGDVHPLLQEYRRDLLTCGLSDDALLWFEVVVDDSSVRSHSHIEAEGADAGCLREAFAQVPFERLAPPTGTLIASGQLLGAELTSTPDVWRTSDMMQNRILAVKDGESWRVPDRFMSSQSIKDIHAVLDCSEEHDVVWVNAARAKRSLDSAPAWTVETVPSEPCVEDAVRQHWEDVLAAAFGDRVEDPTRLRLSFNIIRGYPEGR